MKITANPFVHVELTSDPESAKAFYAKLFQWEVKDLADSAVPDDSYTLINMGFRAAVGS